MNLSNKEAREFALLLIGLDCFLKKLNLIRMSKPSFLKDFNSARKNEKFINDSYSFRLKYVYEGKNNYIVYRNDDRKICCFNNENEMKFISLIDFSTELSGETIDLLIEVCHKGISRDKESVEKQINSLFKLRKTNHYGFRFITGSGIDSKYGLPSWHDFESQFINVVDSSFGSGICESISKQVFNTNYGSFQIVKDVFYGDYLKLLEKMINSALVPAKADNTTLTAVAAVLFAQSIKYPSTFQFALTFNYDDLLEKALEKCFGEPSLTFYKNFNPNPIPSGFSLAVLHSHGFLPKKPEPVLKKHINSIVLTTNEYFDNYKNNSSYGYKSLYNHLDDICYFVGNGLIDYEEQKVIDEHFHNHPSQFHFCFFSKKGISLEAIVYKTIFLLKLGIIPLWYDDHSIYKDELYEYAETLINQKLR